MSSVSRLSILALAALATRLIGCSSGCSTVGCTDSLGASGTVTISAGDYPVEVCINSACSSGTLSVRDLEIGHCDDLHGALHAQACIGHPIPPKLPPPDYTRELDIHMDPAQVGEGAAITVQVKRPDGSALVDVRTKVHYKQNYPNGPSCGGACRNGLVAL